MEVKRAAVAVLGVWILSTTYFLKEPIGIDRSQDDYVRPKPAPFHWKKRKSNISTVQKVDNKDDCHLLPLGRNSCSIIPNFFLYQNRREDFKDAIINFWHIQKTGGTTLRQCIKGIYEDLNFPSPFVSTPRCTAPISSVLHDITLVTNMTYKPVIFGHYSLGVCDFVHEVTAKRKCSVFTIFRDPYERAVSNYFFNKQNLNRHPSMRDLVELPINEYLKKKGSVVWNSFLYPHIKITSDEKGVKRCLQERVVESIQSLRTSWPENKTVMGDILNNLDKRLSFVGLFEDLPTTYKMLQEIYQLPFYDMCSDVHLKKGLYERVPIKLQDKLKRDAKQMLMNDSELEELMEFDVKMYKRAKEIFYAQKAEFDKMQN